jgi:glycosyltransferase involved in cell wall biosynthesis
LERQSHELSKQLVRLGVEVNVISGMLPTNRHSFENVEGVDVTRIPWTENKSQRFIKSWYSLAKAMFKLRNKYDIVHVHSVSWFGVTTIFIAKLLNKPVLAKLPGFGTSGIPVMQGRLLGRVLIRVFKSSDAIVAMTWESVDELRKINFPDTRVFRMTNGVSTEQFAPTFRKDRDQKETLNVVYCGRLNKRKGLLDLMAIWPDVLKNIGRPCVLKMYGSGPLRTELENLIARLGLQDKVAMMGHANNIVKILHQSDLFVLPSHAEGNSNAILEAMSVGLPIVSTKTGGTPMLVGSEGADYLVDVGDLDALQSRIVDLLKNDEKRLALGRAMLARINSHFRMEIVAQRYMLAYRCLVENQRDRIDTLSTPVFLKK